MGSKIGICPICNKQVFISSANTFAHMCRVPGEYSVMRTHETLDIDMLGELIPYAIHLANVVSRQKEERIAKRRERNSSIPLPFILIEDDIF